MREDREKKILRPIWSYSGRLLEVSDTDLWITLEKDLISHGDELVFGAGKTSRDGIGVYPLASKEEERIL